MSLTSILTKSICLAVVLTFTTPHKTMAQFNDDIADSTEYMKGWKTTKNGMLVLSSWALANMGTGFYFMGETEGVASSFHQMNGMWNTVNFTLGTIGYFKSRSRLKKIDLSSHPDELKRQIKILKINTYLDMGYIAIGGLSYGLANQFSDPDLAKGYGLSVITQGAFLLVFDYFLKKKIKSAIY